MKVAYLDIETDYIGKHTDQQLFSDHKNHLLIVVGVLVVDRKVDDFVQLVDKDISKKRLLEILQGIERVVTYNGRSVPDSVKNWVGFDFPVIAAQLGVVLDNEFNHKDLVPECWKRNLYGGLKKVEGKLGLVRSLPGKNGQWATDTWRKYLATGKKTYLEELLAYNKEDVYMLRAVEEKLARIPVVT